MRASCYNETISNDLICYRPVVGRPFQPDVPSDAAIGVVGIEGRSPWRTRAGKEIERSILMTWLQRYRVGHYLRNSVWIVPAATIVVAMVLVRVLHGIEESLGWEAALSPETARTVVGALAGAMFTFIVFVCSSLLLVVQL